MQDLVRGLPVLKFDNDSLCAACEVGKQHKQGHPITIDSKIVAPLELLHIDLLLGRVLCYVLRLLGSLASPLCISGMGLSIREFSRV